MTPATQSTASLKAVMDSRRDNLISLQAMWRAGQEIGNSEAYVTRSELIAAEAALHEAYLDWTCA